MIFESNLPAYFTIGYEGEQNAREIRFDISKELERWPDSTPTLFYVRPKEQTAYPATATVEGSELVWTPDAYAMQKEGSFGAAQIVFTVDGDDMIIGKSKVMRMSIIRSIETSEDPPEPYESWIAQMLSIASDAVSAAARAAASAVSAEESADRAEASAVEAKAAEQGAINALAEADSPVAYGIEQTLTEAQKATARGNIGAMAADAMEMATVAETMTYVTGG